MSGEKIIKNPWVIAYLQIFAEIHRVSQIFIAYSQWLKHRQDPGMSCGVKWSDLTAEFYGVSTVLIMGRSGISMDFVGSKHHLEFFFPSFCWVMLGLSWVPNSKSTWSLPEKACRICSFSWTLGGLFRVYADFGEGNGLNKLTDRYQQCLVKPVVIVGHYDELPFLVLGFVWNGFHGYSQLPRWTW